MRAAAIFSAITALATLAVASPIKTKRSNGELAVYWGQENVERDLADYCQSGQGINILILAFLSNFGGGNYPNGQIHDCQINEDGSFSGCSQLASDIQTCQNAGIKVFISLGGGGATWAIDGTNDASGIAYSLWYSYGPQTSGNSSPRPFGSVKIDGWDFDLESNPKNEASNYLGDLINSLRGYFSSDSSKSYYISGAPQCVIPDANEGKAINQAQFDYLFIQFYNNNCAAADYTDPSGTNPDGNGQYNFASWPAAVANGASSGASLLVGLPASKAAAETYDYIPTTKLASLISNSQGVAGFGGVMLYDAGQSDDVSVNNCNYAQNVAAVLSTGAPCT